MTDKDYKQFVVVSSTTLDRMQANLFSYLVVLQQEITMSPCAEER